MSDHYDASSRKDVRKAEKQAKLSREVKLSAVAGIMSVQAGRHWMHELLEEWNAFSTPFTGSDAHTNFNCGVQSCALRVLADIMQACPDDYILMMREANERYLSSAERRRSEKSDGGDTGAEPDQDGDEAGDETRSQT